MADDRMRCWIYKSSRKEEMYLYLPREDDFDAVPAVLLERFGRPLLVMELELHGERRLAREDPVQVMRSLRSAGFHLQLPPQADSALDHGSPL